MTDLNNSYVEDSADQVVAQREQSEVFGASKCDFKIEKLCEDNYVTWKWQVENVLKAKSIHVAIIGRRVDEANRQALALLGSALSQDNMALVVGCDNAFDVWKRLEIIFENNIRKAGITREITFL